MPIAGIFALDNMLSTVGALSHRRHDDKSIRLCRYAAGESRLAITARPGERYALCHAGREQSGAADDQQSILAMMALMLSQSTPASPATDDGNVLCRLRDSFRVIAAPRRYQYSDITKYVK